MAYWAKLDNNRIVTQVIRADEDFIASGAVGVPQNWIQTSYTGEFRKNFAGIGYTYDLIRNAFIPPKPYPSWILNETTCQWEAPIPYPGGPTEYVWDEQQQAWVPIS
jgi:hypothetical protein